MQHNLFNPTWIILLAFLVPFIFIANNNLQKQYMSCIPPLTGDCIDSNTFTLPGHESENLSDQESAERIADYFAQISQEFPPLDRKLLPLRVQQKLDSQSSLPPIIDSHDAYQKIKAAKKTKSGVPGDLPE